jgi:hypothetical protein
MLPSLKFFIITLIMQYFLIDHFVDICIIRWRHLVSENLIDHDGFVFWSFFLFHSWFIFISYTLSAGCSWCCDQTENFELLPPNWTCHLIHQQTQTCCHRFPSPAIPSQYSMQSQHCLQCVSAASVF